MKSVANTMKPPVNTLLRFLGVFFELYNAIYYYLSARGLLVRKHERLRTSQS